MTLWIILTALTAFVAAALAVPLIRRIEPPQSDRDRILAVSRDQLAEIEADQARGIIGAREVQEARHEIERRALAAVKDESGALNISGDRTRLISLAIVSGWIVVGAALLYVVVGRPDLASQRRGDVGNAALLPAAPGPANDAVTQSGAGASAGGSVEEMIVDLAARLKENPNDAEGWRMLAWSYFNTERYAQSAEAYGKAVALDPSDANVWSAYGETLVRSARGLVSHDAIAAFDAALAINPDDPRARFFKGMALEQAGDPAAAVEAWIAIAQSAPAGAEWLPGMVQRIEELAAASNIDLGDRLTSPAPAPGGLAGTDLALPPAAALQSGPTAADVAAAGDMTEADRQAMIEGMVAQLAQRLDESPDDPQGWARLISSRMVLNDPDAARAALDRARDVFAGDPGKLSIVLDAARAAGLAVN